MEEGRRRRKASLSTLLGRGSQVGDIPLLEEPWKPGALAAEQKLALSRRLPEASLVSGAAPPALASRGAGRGRGRGCKSAQPGGPTGVSHATAFPSRLFEQVREKMPGLPGRHFWG